MANDSYDLIDRFLRNNLDDADYAEHSKALDSLLASHAGEPIAYANPVILLPDEEGGGWEAKVQSHCDDVFSLPLYATPPAATPAAPGEVTDEQVHASAYKHCFKASEMAPQGEQLYLFDLARIKRLCAALSHPAPVAAPAPASEAVAQSIAIDFKQATELLEMFGDQPCEITLTAYPKDEHHFEEGFSIAAGLYAHYTDCPEEGGNYLGVADHDATPAGDSADAPVQQAGDGQSSCATKEPSVARQVAEKTGAASQVRKQFAHYQERSYMSNAAKDVLAERQRQISAEGWTPEHDDEHDDGRMAIAAAHYAMHGIKGWGRVIWPWDKKWLKPKDRRSNLIRASALIIAEIERIDRAALKGEQPEPSGSERGEV